MSSHNKKPLRQELAPWVRRNNQKQKRERTTSVKNAPPPGPPKAQFLISGLTVNLLRHTWRRKDIVKVSPGLDAHLARGVWPSSKSAATAGLSIDPLLALQDIAADDADLSEDVAL